MIFLDQIQAKDAELGPEFDRLFALAVANQSHPGDLLLLLENGSYKPEVLDYVGHNLSTYVIGPGTDGLAYHTHYKFINNYRHRVSTSTHAEYLAELAALVASRDWPARDQLEAFEETTIHLESLIYIKIWESDFFIKRFYEFVRILLGEPFDWRFRVSEYNRDPTATGVRHKILRELVRNKVQPISTILYASLAVAYKPQVRNSIAHSNFAMQGRHIQLNNYAEQDPGSQLHVITFDEWVEMFHYTLALYNELVGLGNRIRTHYAELAASQGNRIEVLVPDREGTPRQRIIKYRPHFNDFRYWNPNDDKDDE
jgi:hypothetical protein